MTQLATSGLPSQPASSSEASPPLFYEEPRSTSTRTNAVNTLDLIAAEDICGAKLLIVTSRYNQRRAWRVFKKVVHLHHRTVDVEMVGFGVGETRMMATIIMTMTTITMMIMACPPPLLPSGQDGERADKQHQPSVSPSSRILGLGVLLVHGVDIESGLSHTLRHVLF